jgi:hypothetical protein
MSTIARCCAVLPFLALPFACSSSDSSTSTATAVVTDTLGYKFNVFCDTGLCGLSPLDSDLVAKSCGSSTGTDYFILVPDPLLVIYAVNQSPSGLIAISPAEPSHPVACASDADCMPSGMPSAYGNLTYVCRYGLCQCTSAKCATADGYPLTYDVLTLCQADIPWPTACPYITSELFAKRIGEVAAACGTRDTCATVPASCRQLTGPATPPIDGGAQSAMDGG